MQTIIRDINTTAGQIPDLAIKWLHGLGADGNDFVSAVDYLDLADNLGVRFVFPTAAMRSVTINNGLQMRSWYDIKAMLPQRVTDLGQLQESVDLIHREVEALVAEGIDQSKIIVVGFSQGGAVAYELALTAKVKLLGVVAMSTYIASDLTVDRCLAAKDLNILSIHGSHDEVVPCSLGERSVDKLKELGFAPHWHTYPMGHQVTLETLSLVGEWITEKIKS